MNPTDTVQHRCIRTDVHTLGECLDSELAASHASRVAERRGMISATVPVPVTAEPGSLADRIVGPYSEGDERADWGNR